ncbi:asparagine synthase C-terminal domain-containing protein [Ideonella sp. DXS22W]|uniref:asparagine synthase (glutamine-hydrolyzing) n=1 Tax=Pseudaquabacterium inlustre TaxID=2984192 RepID=A0ABU9CNZ1_9BURK
MNRHPTPSGELVDLADADPFGLQSRCWRRDADGTVHQAARADSLADRHTPLDAQALFEYLYFHCIPSPRTVFAGVSRVPAGHRLNFQGAQPSLEVAWAPRFRPAEKVSFEALREEFRTLLKASVQRAIAGDGPAACFLSGGTDSSTVAGMIREASGSGALAFSIGFEADGYDEMEYARLAARHFGCEHHAYYITPDDLVRSIPEVAGSYDQPFGNSSVLPAYYCAFQARQAGVSRLLAGDGGDELYGGNARYAKQRVFGHYQSVPAPLRSMLEPLLLQPGISRVPILKKAASYVEQARVPMPDRLQMYNLLLRLGIDEVLEPGFLHQVDVQGPTQHQREVWAWAGSGAMATPPSELNRTLAYDWRYTLAESDIPKVRGATTLAGVEVAYPMLDPALLEFSLHLPDDYKLNGLKLRWFFKEALRGFLPDEIINKPKHGFGLPFGPWLLRHAGLRALATDSLLSLGTRGMVRPTFINNLLSQHLAEHPGYYGEMVWILMMLEQWFQQHRPSWRV